MDIKDVNVAKATLQRAAENNTLGTFKVNRTSLDVKEVNVGKKNLILSDNGEKKSKGAKFYTISTFFFHYFKDLLACQYSRVSSLFPASWRGFEGETRAKRP